MTKTDLRKLWLQVHKWIGICLAIVFVPLSFSGSMLVWHETLDAAINPQREIAGDGHASFRRPHMFTLQHTWIVPSDIIHPV
ncbi:MAG: PepSY domain-containing protein [Sphingomonadales bacterium]|nr:PepSY domain-containing protein [Sphingomonadales bacterium]